MRRSRLLLAFAVALAVVPGRAAAHGLASRYELGIPMWMFVVGGVAAVFVSFVGVSVGSESESSFEHDDFAETPLDRLTGSGAVTAARALAVAVLGVSLLSGIFGPAEYQHNLLTLAVWVGWWVGFSFFVIFVGNVWPAVNPWKAVYEWVVAALGNDPSLDREYGHGALPALGLFLAFGWIELVAPVSEDPRWLAGFVGAYSALTWGGMLVYGEETWLSRGDPFTRFFAYLGKFAPLSPRNGGEMRPYCVALIEREDSLYHRGGVAFVIAMLYIVTFDGFTTTPEWRAFVEAMPELPVPYVVTTTGMLVGLVGFLAAYWLVCWGMVQVTGTSLSPGYLARRFALSLLPIAVVYQIAHYYTFLLVQAQAFPAALADPFGLGWNLLGLAAVQPSGEIPFLSITVVWLTQLALIVVGHIIAVWVAHRIAMDAFENRREAVRSQVPMMALMISYTAFGLWILTRPVVEVPPL